MKILITGARGRLGSRLVEILNPEHDVTGVDVVGMPDEKLDITDFAATKTLLQDLQPNVTIHAAAWTDVDGCARDPERALLANGIGTQNVAIATHAVNSAIVYVSSNEVFPGTTGKPCYEYDPTAPVNPYAYSKWYGEQAVRDLNSRHYIARTSWLFAHGGKNFIQAILNAAEAGKNLRVVTDEVAHPTYNDDLADAIASLIQTERFGIYHLVNEGACSRYDFARYALDQAGYADTPIERIASHEWQRLSIPPTYTRLMNIAGKSVGVQLRPWQEAVTAFLEKEGLLATESTQDA